MEKKEQYEIISLLEPDRRKNIFKTNKEEIFVIRPSKLSKRFKDYDPTKNFQIWLKESDREFMPNHLRVMIDINLRVRSRPDLKEKLLIAFDNIFYGNAPEEELKELKLEKFEHYLNDIIVIGYLAQLFIIEQELGYNKESQYSPPTLFFQGWIRQFLDSPKEIDNLCMSVCNGQPPSAKYTTLENKKHKKFVSNLKPLWYLQDNL